MSQEIGKFQYNIGGTHFLDSYVCFHDNSLIGSFLRIIMAEGSSWESNWFRVSGLPVQTHQVGSPTHVPTTTQHNTTLTLNSDTYALKSKADVGSEVLTTMVRKSSIFWNITLSSPLKFNWCFGGIYRLHLQGRNISHARTSVKQSPMFSYKFRVRSWLNNILKLKFLSLRKYFSS
jgi:hypothetical protein